MGRIGIGRHCLDLHSHRDAYSYHTSGGNANVKRAPLRSTFRRKMLDFFVTDFLLHLQSKEL